MAEDVPRIPNGSQPILTPPVGESQLQAFTALYGTETLAVRAAIESEPPENRSSLAVVIHDGTGRALVRRGALTLTLPTVEDPSGTVVEEVHGLLGSVAPDARPGALVPLGTIEHRGSTAAARVLAVLVRVEGIDRFAPGRALIEFSRLRSSQRVSELERLVLKAAEERLAVGIVEVPGAEVKAASEHRFRHAFHRHVMKPILWRFSSARLRSSIVRHVGNATTVLDVACGDDHLVIDLAARGALCVANDAAAASLVDLVRHDRTGRVVPTQRNLADLGLCETFDVAICKNVLHHLEPAECDALFATLRDCARRIVCVDIVDVSDSWRARAWNSYYRRFLGDQGTPRFSAAGFSRFIREAFPNRRVAFESIKTIKGHYALAHVT